MNHPRDPAERRRLNRYAKEVRSPKYRPRVVKPRDKWEYKRLTKKEILNEIPDTEDQS